MTALFEYFPLILFFLVYKFVDIFWATAVLIGVSLLSMSFQFLFYKKISLKSVLFFTIALLLGGMTILFQDEQFIKWKTTAIYGALAISLVVSRYLLNKNLVKVALLSMLRATAEKQGKRELNLDIPRYVFEQLNRNWFIFLASIAFLNLYVAYNFSLDFWVNFKVFGLAAITFFAILFTLFSIFKYLPDGFEEEEKKL